MFALRITNGETVSYTSPVTSNKKEAEFAAEHMKEMMIDCGDIEVVEYSSQRLIDLL